MYVQGIEKANLFIKQGTNDVPNDKRFHVVKDNKIIGSFKNLKQALPLYKESIPKNIGGNDLTPIFGSVFRGEGHLTIWIIFIK